jgi:putative hydrolase of the HAD superfamily
MSEIKTILWDVGGVLLTNGWDRCERDELFRRFQLDKQAFEERHTLANDPWEKGLISADEYLAQTVFYEPRSFTPQQFLDAMKEQSQVLPNSALRILAELAASDSVQMAALNNEARELNDYRIEQFGLRESIPCFLSSCYVGLRKPDAKIFRLALDVLQRQPDEVIFVDDRDSNAEAASSLGIHGIHYQGPEALATELTRLGVNLTTR